MLDEDAAPGPAGPAPVAAPAVDAAGTAGGVVVRFEPGPLPAAGTACAGCGAPAAHARSLPAPTGEAFLLPECGACRRGVEAWQTGWLAIGLAVALGALGAGAALLLRGAGALAVWLGAAAVAVAGLGAALALRRPPRGAAWRPAARWLGPGALHCDQAGFAATLVRAGGRPPPAEEAPPPRAWRGAGLPRVAWLLPLGAVAVAGVSALGLRGTVRAINLGERDLTLRVDGAAVRRLLPGSVESPAAGGWLTLPAGRHHLEATLDDGTVVFDHHVTVAPLREHLWVAQAGAHCFSVERVAVGAGAAPPTREPLRGPVAFWPLPPIDVWFAPVPPGVAAPLSGGTVAAVRHARCGESPRTHEGP